MTPERHLKESPGSEKEGLVISYFGNSVAVESQDGKIIPCHLRRNQTKPVVGDKVCWQMNDAEAGVILKILPRYSTLIKNEGKGKVQAIAANIDLVVIMMAPPPLFSEYPIGYLFFIHLP